MPPIESLIAFSIAAFLMNLSPGPSNFYIMARTISQGIRGGLAAVAGLAVGGLVHVIAAVFGLSALFNYSPTAYFVFKTAGALYLIYLGINYFRQSKSTEQADALSDSPSASKIFSESIIVEVTNPKTALFFLALLPQFVVPEAGPTGPQFLVLGLIVTVSAIPCDLFVTFFASKAADWIKTNPKAQVIQNRISGSVLTGLGIFVLASED